MDVNVRQVMLLTAAVSAFLTKSVLVVSATTMSHWLDVSIQTNVSTRLDQLMIAVIRRLVTIQKGLSRAIVCQVSSSMKALLIVSIKMSVH